MKRGIGFIGVGVGAVIVDEQGRLFLARRGPEAKNEPVPRIIEMIHSTEYVDRDSKSWENHL